MIVALTANGPGEFAGWLRPLVAALYDRAPDVDVRIFCVPDDYATGHEPAYAQALFPRAVVYPSSTYLGFALGRSPEGLPARVDRVQYLGGDLMHAARVHARLGGVASSYKFSRRRYAERFARVFAVDEANGAQLRAWGTPPDRVVVVGNLAIDGALGEADGRFGVGDDGAARDGIVLFPGSRRNEVAHALPMFVRIAVEIRRRIPDVPIAFARTPFTTDDELAAALARGGAPTVYGLPGFLERDAAGRGVGILADGQRFALVGAAMRAARSARLAVSIPGTKVVELAALGIPAVTITPFNAPELIVINGPLQYLGRVPVVGAPLKRGVVSSVARRFRWFAQPNIDAGCELIPEQRGTILPSRVASLVADRYADDAWRSATSAALRSLYAAHAGAADRMARALLE